MLSKTLTFQQQFEELRISCRLALIQFNKGGIIVNIKQIYKETKHTEITNDFVDKIKIDKKNISSEERKFLQKVIEKFKSNNIEDTLKAIKFYSIWEPDECIAILRKKGVFRYKAYRLEDNNVLYLLNELIKCKKIFKFSEITLKYMEEKKQLSWLFDFYKNSENKLIKYIKNHHKKRMIIRRKNRFFENALFKDLLAYIDLFFFKGINPNHEDYLDKDKLKGYTQEEICDGVSYIILLYDKIIGIKQDVSYFTNSKYVLSHDIEYIILIACKVIELQEWELSIDYFDYHTCMLKDELTIFDNSGMMEKSIRMGYSRTEMQEFTFFMDTNSIYNEALSLDEVCDEIVKQTEKIMTQEVNDGALSRYKFLFPQKLLNVFKDEKLFAKKLFKEEIMSIEYCAKELIITFEEASRKQITEHCNLFDILLFQRFFIFINKFLEKTLFIKEDQNKVISSLIPAFRTEILTSILNKFLDEPIKSQELLNLFTFRNDVKLDLQYTPFLMASDNIIFPNTVVSKSNMLRNCIQHSYLIKNQIVNDDNGLETLVKRCSEIFSKCKANYQVLTNKKFKHAKQNGEVDVIVVSNDDIILIECKAPLIPVNNFEMRSSLGHIEKANKQLSFSKKAFEDKSFRKNNFKNWGIEDKNQNIRTCIVFGNRLFSGYRCDILKHPISYVYELNTLLNIGKIESNLGKWSVWNGEEYDHKDLINYLTEGNSLAQMNFEAMDNISKTMTIEGKKVVFKTYEYNLVKGFQIYDSELKIIDSNDELKKQIIDEYRRVSKL